MISEVECPRGTFCGPTAIASVLHGDIHIVTEACREAILMTEGVRKPMKVKGMSLAQMKITIEMLTGVDMTHKLWTFVPEGRPVIIREWLESGRSKLIYGRNILMCGGLGGSLHVMAVHKEFAVDTMSRGCIVPVQHLNMRRCLMDSYLAIEPDIRITEEAKKIYGRSNSTASTDERRRAASSFRQPR